VELYRRKVENLHEALGQPETRTQDVEAIRPLIERITLCPTEKGFQVELVGEIPNVLAISNGLDPNALIERHRSTTRVAGFYDLRGRRPDRPATIPRSVRTS
jgi:hypothetical protein